MKKSLTILFCLMSLSSAMWAQRGTEYELTPFAAAMKCGDINGDGLADVLVSHYNNDGQTPLLTLLMNDGEGRLAPAGTIECDMAGFPDYFLLEDFDNDGFPDIAVYLFVPGEDGNTGTCLLTLYHNTGEGGFVMGGQTPLTQPDQFWDNPYYRLMTAGDFNHDGFMDVAVSTDYNSNAVASTGFLLNDGAGEMTAPEYLYGASLTLGAVGDVNNDGNDDVADGCRYYVSETFPPVQKELYASAWDCLLIHGMAVVDLDGDNLPDMVEARSDDAIQVRFLQNQGAAGFAMMNAVEFPGTVTPYGDSPNNLRVFNLDGDEYPDYIVQTGQFRTEFTGYSILKGKGNFDTEAPVTLPLEDEDEGFRTFEVCDVNGDGLDDLLVLRSDMSFNSWLTVILNDDLQDLTRLSEEKDSFYLQPNPATGMVTVTGANIHEVEIHNLLGQRVAVVEGHDAESLTVSLEGLPEGVYLVSIRLADGKRCEKKLVVY